MAWYGYILYGLFILACLTLVGVVLLQPGKGDAAAAFGGGSQTAFGPRGAQKPLERVTFIAAGAFMLLAFLFSLPGITSPRPVSSGIDTMPAPTLPAPPKPAAPASTAPASSAPVTTAPATSSAPVSTAPASNTTPTNVAKPADNKANKTTPDTKKSEPSKTTKP